jgi:protoporphyrin/coproporphyrin ferrochelatase
VSRRAVVLLNLGAPDSTESVRTFLFNLFNDPAIITLWQPLRWLIATLIAHRRAPVARAIYERLGGGSPLLANTRVQAAALGEALGSDHRVFVAMRHWHPMSTETAAAVKEWGADEIVLLPLYPQFSTTSSGSSLAAWEKAAAGARLTTPTRAICCYPDEPGFIAALAAGIERAIAQWPSGERFRLLFSAHGLPRKTVAAGDPYEWQVERTIAALRSALARPHLDSIICYQSRVGPLAWLEPATDAEIRRAGRDGVGVIVVPIAFVSEHSETLVELDMEYRHLAESVGVPRYVRVPAVGTAPEFIAALARLVRNAPHAGPAPSGGRRLCPRDFGRCACVAP